MSAPALSGQSSDTGTLRGRVYNAGTGNYVEGAEVTVEGTGLSASTDSLGRYVIERAPAGEVKLLAFYRGVSEGSVGALLPAGGSIVVDDIGLGEDDVVLMSDFIVQAELEGQAKIVAQQREAPNIVTAIATDAYGNVGSNSVGNLLQFLPGLSTEGFDGEAMSVSVRGMDPGYGSVTTDGAKLAGSFADGGLDRTTYVLDIGLVNFSEVEVIKAPMPNKGADSTGGVVNLKTRSVFASREPRTIRASVGVGTTLRDGLEFKQPHPSFTFNYRQLLGDLSDPKWGFTFNASSNTRYIVRDQTTIDYESTFSTLNPDTPYVNNVGKQVSHQEVTRRSVGGRIEFKPSDTSRFTLDLKYNYMHRFSENNTRTWVSGGNGVGAVVLPAGYETGTRYTGGTRIRNDYTNDAVFWPRGQFQMRSLINTQNSEGSTLRFAGEHKLGLWDIDYDVNQSAYQVKSRRSGDFGGQAEIRVSDVGLLVSGFNESPDWDVQYVGGNDPLNLSKANYFRFYDWNQNWKEANTLDSSFNASRKFDFEGAPTMVSAGLNFRSQDQSQLPTVYDLYNYTGAWADVSSSWTGYASPFAKDDSPHNTLARYWAIYGYDLIDAGAVRADALKNNPQNWSAPIAQNGGKFDRGFEEDISSAYVMATSKLFNQRLMVLGGVRFERTDVTAFDNLRADPIAGTPGTRGKDSYTDAFPSLHTTWKINPQFQLRASYSTSIGRPSAGSIIPGITVTEYTGEDLVIPGRISKINVGLKPRYVDNYELAAELYPQQGGRFSVGLFRKEMSSFIYSISEIIGAGPDNGFDGDYEGWELQTQANGGAGTLEGWEVDYQSPQLGKYTSLLNGFSVFANYTHLKANGDYGDGGAQTLAGFKPETGNLGVAYRRNGTSIRLRGNYVSTYLRFPNGNPALERYEWRKFKVDLNIERKLTEHMSAYIDIINLNNSKGRRYRGNPDDGFRLNWVDNNGPEFYAGINLLY